MKFFNWKDLKISQILKLIYTFVLANIFQLFFLLNKEKINSNNIRIIWVEEIEMQLLIKNEFLSGIFIIKAELI
jgi:hypothetical protein